jgi:hypothetical protein|tara:strand:+ start:2468 stop:2608 length:141 start_codon:yes stop_codon:yes gene_type:complete
MSKECGHKLYSVTWRDPKNEKRYNHTTIKNWKWCPVCKDMIKGFMF